MNKPMKTNEAMKLSDNQCTKCHIEEVESRSSSLACTICGGRVWFMSSNPPEKYNCPYCHGAKWRNYLVRLRLIIGEYEKQAYTIVKAKDDIDAGIYAIYAETHRCDTMEWENDCAGAYDDSGGMHYTVSRVDHIEGDELATLKRYLFSCHYNQSDLDEAGNYLEKTRELK